MSSLILRIYKIYQIPLTYHQNLLWKSQGKNIRAFKKRTFFWDMTILEERWRRGWGRGAGGRCGPGPLLGVSGSMTLPVILHLVQPGRLTRPPLTPSCSICCTHANRFFLHLVYTLPDVAIHRTVQRAVLSAVLEDMSVGLVLGRGVTRVVLGTATGCPHLSGVKAHTPLSTWTSSSHSWASDLQSTLLHDHCLQKLHFCDEYYKKI